MDERMVTVWFNPHCSKCQGAEELLTGLGVPMSRVFYLDDPPPRAEIERVLRLLEAEDPRAMMRTQEPLYEELQLDVADDQTLITAMSEHPELIERPIVIRGDHAVVARPPGLLLALFPEL